MLKRVGHAGDYRWLACSRSEQEGVDSGDRVPTDEPGRDTQDHVGGWGVYSTQLEFTEHDSVTSFAVAACRNDLDGRQTGGRESDQDTVAIT